MLAGANGLGKAQCIPAIIALFHESEGELVYGFHGETILN